MKLNELFDNPSKWEWIDDHIAQFKIDDLMYEVEFYDEREGEWELDFALMKGSGIGKVGAEVGITKTGNSIQVMSSVLAIIKAFIKMEDVQQLNFDALEPSRIKLYRSIAKRFSSTYDLTIIKPTGGLKNTKFELRKK